MLTKTECAKVLACEFIFFPSITVGPELVAAWWGHFQDCSAQEFATALHRAVNAQTDKWPPSPGQVRGIIKASRKGPSELETPEQAFWAVFNKQNPSTRALAAWKLLPASDKPGLWETASMPFKVKDFCRIYESLKEQSEAQESQGGAIGLSPRGELTSGEQKVLGVFNALSRNR
jgi:hypothetical protein